MGNRYDKEEVAIFIDLPGAISFHTIDCSLTFDEFQAFRDKLIELGAVPDSICLRINAGYENYSPEFYFFGQREETDAEFDERIAKFERRSAASKAANEKRQATELAKAKKTLADAEATIENIKKKFGDAILTD